MKKLLLIIIAFSLVLTNMTSCRDSNLIMYSHLSDPNSYSTHVVSIKNITEVTYDDDSEEIQLLVSFKTLEETAKFKGVSVESLEKKPEDINIILVINGNNVKELYDNDFHKIISIGDDVTIKVSSFIYMDTNFFYVIELIKEDNVILDGNIGLKNVIAFMEKNKSIF